MKSITFSRMLMMSCGIAALATPAFAQNATGAAAVEEVVVTGSRIVRNGFQAPTPVTTLAADDLAARAPTNIPDALNQLPQFRGSAGNSRSVTWNTNSPNQGNYLNLRGLGTARSLILLDGVRVPPTSFAGGVDTNTLPQALVQRVDVVTGGASAAYGSDAVVGVVNFILDKNFNGVKGSVQFGTSNHFDNNSYKATVAAGMPFADGRGHIEGSVELYNMDPISTYDRENGRSQIQRVGKGGTPTRSETLSGVRFANVTWGGYILNGPLTGYEFLQGGGIQVMPKGTPITGNTAYVLGGGGAYWQNHTLVSGLNTKQSFGRASYDITDNVSAHFQASIAQSRNIINTRVDERLANSTTVTTIFRDNAFLQPSVVTALGPTTQSFQMSRISYDTPQNWGSALNNSQNYNLGVEGKFEVMGREWNWDTNYVYGISHLRQRVNEFNNQRFYTALDSVISNGQAVCRANVVAPGSAPGCVPLNYFGVGAPTQAAIDYISWMSQYRAVNEMNIVAANLSGDLFDLPAGPVSIAFGGEMRRQRLNLTSNTDPATAASVAARYNGVVRGVPAGVLISDFTNIGVARGAVKVKEAYVELAVPLLKDLPFVQSLDLNGALRVTDYSTSGTVETWKIGLNYVPVNDLRVRATVSRDIAAPSLYQLYQGTTVVANLGVDIHTGQTVSRVTETTGNANLSPEVGSMVVAGVVYQPSFLPGLQFSVDGYSLYITDAIGAANANTLQDECEASNGTSSSCQFIIRPLPFSNRTPANSWIKVIQTNLNQAKRFQSGLDLELAYRFPLWDGAMQVRGLGTIVTANRTKSSPTTATTNGLGNGDTPRISGSIEANYVKGPVGIRLSQRYTGKTRRTITGIDENYPIGPNVAYTDANLSYKFDNQEVFLNVQNLFDTQPPIVADGANPGLQFPTNRGRYDVIGRYVTLGLRFKL